MRALFQSGLIAVIFACGCVSVPTDPVTDAVTTRELSQHVDFLTQRALKGRSAGSRQSKRVQQYLSQRLSDYGCVPWTDNQTFALDFGFGKNIIGVLGGSDPQLADEMVLISAHYDHLRPGLFKWYPGACDNAAAVAVLLEIAERISQRPVRPKRPIVFALFDAEEVGCVGSYAFTCRDDYEDGKIAAALNMDLLGRDLLDVVDNCLIATGTDNYAPLQQRIRTACEGQGLQFVPLESDLIGPVGDHTAFVSNERPVLFFTCGINKDYHQPTDTPEKLNYEKLKRESAVIEQTLLSLADGDPSLFAPSPVPLTAQTCEALSFILNKFKDHRDVFELDPNGIAALDRLIAETQQADPNSLTRADLLNRQRQSIATLIGLLKNYNPTLSQFSEAFVQISEYYAVNPPAFTAVYRQMIQHYLTHKPSLFGSNQFSYRDVLPINDKSWGLVPTADGAYLFGFIDLEANFENEWTLLKGNSFSLGLNGKLTACKGSLEAIVSFAFWGRIQDPNAFRMEMVGFRSGDSKNTTACSPANLNRRRNALMTAFCRDLEHRFPQELHSPAVRRLYDPNSHWVEPNTAADQGFGTDPNGPFSEINGFRIFLTARDLGTPGKEERQLLAFALSRVNDRARDADERADWIAYLAWQKTRDALTAVADLLGDETPWRQSYSLMADDRYPLKYHPFVKQHLAGEKEIDQKRKGKTLGQIARENLKRVTKQDFKTDPQAWKDWIEKHYD